jgi:hypothetical protein
MKTNEITKSALKELNYRGYECWRQNQVRVPGRVFIGKVGLSDIIGFDRQTGRFMVCEIKGKGDKLSPAQIDFLNTTQKAGCVVLLATVNDRGKFILTSYEPVCDTRTAALIQ